MISHSIKLFCKDYTKIENYEQAVNDETQVWDCHHRLETHFSDGTERPKNAQITIKELKALGMYYNRPPEEFIFLTSLNHKRLHQFGIKRGSMNKDHKKKISESNKGKKRSEETRKKISEAGKGHKPWNLGGKLSEEHKKKLSESKKGHYVSEESKKKMSKSHKGIFKDKHWKIVDGKRVWY